MSRLAWTRMIVHFLISLAHQPKTPDISIKLTAVAAHTRMEKQPAVICNNRDQCSTVVVTYLGLVWTRQLPPFILATSFSHFLFRLHPQQKDKSNHISITVNMVRLDDMMEDL